MVGGTAPAHEGHPPSIRSDSDVAHALADQGGIVQIVVEANLFIPSTDRRLITEEEDLKPIQQLLLLQGGMNLETRVERYRDAQKLE